jgi:hypothetical protein
MVKGESIRQDQGARVRLDHYIGHLDYHYHATEHEGFRIGHAHKGGDLAHDHDGDDKIVTTARQGRTI